MTHRAKAPDGLDASKITKCDGGKTTKVMRDGWFFNADGERVVQKMQHPDGTTKGYQTILTERGKWPPNGLQNLCDSCKAHIPREERIAGGFNVQFCCSYGVLSEEPDFSAQKEWLTETVESFDGFTIIFYPKYHCELNFIELLWGWTKQYHRKTCTYNFQHLYDGLPNTYEHVIPQTYVRRAFRYVCRFMDGYRQNLSGPLLAYTVKKYKSHRTIPANVIDLVQREFDEAQKTKRPRTAMYDCK
jgi:hypothetical protein